MKFALNEHFLLITNASLIRDTFVDGYITAILPKGLSTKIFFYVANHIAKFDVFLSKEVITK